ncbi:MAG: metal-dependent transcriptional regulator [Spirochaetales bacterium]|nr:metal-dependent transcriptional regulator [Spirochaetales bacterium]
MENKINLTPSLEDYLEAILQLEEKNRVARVKDIAERLSVQMPSVTGALKNLKSKGLIEYEKNSFINLTPQGKELAEAVLSKHKILLSFLENSLFLGAEKAADEACRIEHSIDKETARRVDNLNSFLTKTYSEKELEKIILG